MFVVLAHQPLDPAQVGGTHTGDLGETDLVEPELALAVAILDMDVSRFGALVGVEEEPEGSNAEHGRHTIIIR
jgi:hypothetical protein